MGTGILGLPFACARLGWVVGLAACCLFGLTGIYSGLLLARVKNDFYPEVRGPNPAPAPAPAPAPGPTPTPSPNPSPSLSPSPNYPEAHSYGDLARAMVGPRFGAFTRGAIGLSWALLLPYYLICVVNSLMLAVPDAPLCFWQWTLVVEVGLLLPLQLRSLHLISYLSAASVLAMVVAVGLILISLAYDQGAPGGHSLWPAHDSTALQKFSNAGSFIFAYQGQSMFLEIMREMRAPRHFPRAVLAANGAMVVAYAAAIVVGYGARGSAVQGFLPNSLGPGPLRTCVAALLAFHVAVAYIITGQPLHRTLHLHLFPSTADGEGSAAALHWLCVTSSVLAFGFVVANAIPFFEDFQNLLGSLTGAPILFGWPAFFYLRSCRLCGRKVAWHDLALCALYLGLFLPVFTLLGTINSMLDIRSDWSTLGPPFGCSHGDNASDHGG